MGRIIERSIKKEKLMKELYLEAKKASKYTYSPYSKFPVGAAVITKNGNIFLGANIENASYGLTICAERVAICNAFSSGEKEIKAIAIYSPQGDVSPCGVCRQFILEFGANIEVVYKNNGKLVSSLIIELLPNSFYFR